MGVGVAFWMRKVVLKSSIIDILHGVIEISVLEYCIIVRRHRC